jgi:prepilin-type N-terminal cleavage/methylation domain-containing protein
MLRQTHRVAGFSLIEMLVAVSVLLLVIVGPMTVTSRTAKSSAFASEQVQAFFLAQEGLELAQKLRDDLLLRSFILPTTDPNYVGDPWAQFTDDSNGGAYRFCYGGGCGLQWDDTTTSVIATPINCSTITNCRLYYDTDSDRSKYTYTSLGNEVTPFTRRITLRPVPTASPNSVEVISTVTWRTGSIIAEQSVVAQTYLYNIYARP